MLRLGHRRPHPMAAAGRPRRRGLRGRQTGACAEQRRQAAQLPH